MHIVKRNNPARTRSSRLSRAPPVKRGRNKKAAARVGDVDVVSGLVGHRGSIVLCGGDAIMVIDTGVLP